MSSISGIDLSKVAEYREQVTVALDDKGGVVTLPLIKLKDAQMAEMFISQLDAIQSEWAAITALYEAKAVEGQKLAEQADVDGEISKVDYLKSLKLVTAQAMETQGEHIELLKKVRRVTNGIHEFLEPYLAGTEVLQMLKEHDDVVTQKVLYAMLYGAAALKDDLKEKDDDVKKNQ